MKLRLIAGLASAAIALAQSPPSAPSAPADSFMLRGGTVHTISGATIEDGSVLVRNGKIVGVGKSLTPPAGYKVIDVRGQQIYPGMIDAASMMGLDSQASELKSDAAETGLFNPQLRAVTAMNP